MEETLEQKKRRLFGKQYLVEYLNIVKKLVNPNYEIKLLTIVESDIILNESNELEKKSFLRILFNKKVELKKIITDHFSDNKGIYLYTDLSKDCGLTFIDSINNFNFNFNFDDDPFGLIILINNKCNKKILLDIYEENGFLYIDIEFYW